VILEMDIQVMDALVEEAHAKIVKTAILVEQVKAVL